jgi:dienelactone hydrolase
MRGMAIALLALLLGTGCVPPASSTPESPSASPSPVTQPADFLRYVGAYRTSDGLVLLVNGHGHLLNLEDSAFRQLYATAVADHFTIGPAFAVPSPRHAEVTFHLAGDRADRLTLTPIVGARLNATRLLFKQTEVRVAAAGATLAATVTEPLTPGPHPGIVIVHGSGLGPRIDYGIWVGLYATLGLTVIAYDKRGNGASTGQYPGEFATNDTLNTYAADAATMLRFLAAWPGVDATRVGFHGGSQGGWTVPLAMARFQAPAAFALIASGPAVSVDQQALWASFSNDSTTLPTVSPSDADAQVRAVHGSGYDPRPVLAAIRQPFLWFNGAIDRQVPTTVNAEILRSLHHANWDIDVLPGVDHGLFQNLDGLEPDQPRATNLAAGLCDLLASWLEQHAGAPPTNSCRRTP